MTPEKTLNPDTALLRGELHRLSCRVAGGLPLSREEEHLLWLLRTWDACDEDGLLELVDRHGEHISEIVVAMLATGCLSLLASVAIINCLSGGHKEALNYESQERCSETLKDEVFLCLQLNERARLDLPAFERELLAHLDKLSQPLTSELPDHVVVGLFDALRELDIIGDGPVRYEPPTARSRAGRHAEQSPRA